MYLQKLHSFISGKLTIIRKCCFWVNWENSTLTRSYTGSIYHNENRLQKRIQRYHVPTYLYFFSPFKKNTFIKKLLRMPISGKFHRKWKLVHKQQKM